MEELVEDIDEAADELIDSVQYLQETLNAGEELYESKWIGGVMRAHEMLLKLSAHVKQADAWPCDGEGDEYGNFVCKNPSRLNHAAAVERPGREDVTNNVLSRNEIIEECAKVAEDIQVIEGEPSPELLHEMENDVLLAVEAAGNITKRRIASSIRSLKLPSPETDTEVAP